MWKQWKLLRARMAHSSHSSSCPAMLSHGLTEHATRPHREPLPPPRHLLVSDTGGNTFRLVSCRSLGYIGSVYTNKMEIEEAEHTTPNGTQALNAGLLAGILGSQRFPPARRSTLLRIGLNEHLEVEYTSESGKQQSPARTVHNCDPNPP